MFEYFYMSLTETEAGSSRNLSLQSKFNLEVGAVFPGLDSLPLSWVNAVKLSHSCTTIREYMHCGGRGGLPEGGRGGVQRGNIQRQDLIIWYTTSLVVKLPHCCNQGGKGGFLQNGNKIGKK